MSETEVQVPQFAASPIDKNMLETDIAQKCATELEKFKSASIDKRMTMVEIARLIGTSQTCVGKHRADSIEFYFHILESDDHGGFRTIEPDSNQDGQKDNDHRDEHSRLDGGERRDRDARRDREDRHYERSERHRMRRDKRKCSESTDDELEESPRKSLDTSRLPWEVEEVISPSKLSPSLRETQALLKLFAKDYRAVKTSIITAARHPEFPDSEWDNIIRGRTIDLNKVLSGIFEASAPVRKVMTQGEWNLAWGRATRALTFVFPHRSEELREYGDHITKMFAATNTLYHERIIFFDQSARARAACRRDISLSEFSRFEDLRIMHISDIGSGVISRANAKASGSGATKVNNPCRRFNEGRCPDETSVCKYKHTCRSCRRPGHVEEKCSKKARIN